MSLDQDLMEIEPIFRGTDGTFQFTHPSFQEVLTAKQFADEINSGELSVRDAYVHFWSYEEDRELWDLPKDREWRALLPGWQQVLLHMAPMLENEKAKELVDIVNENYLIVKKIQYGTFKHLYNPFYDDHEFIESIKDVDVSKLIKSLKGNFKEDDAVNLLIRKGLYNKEIRERFIGKKLLNYISSKKSPIQLEQIRCLARFFGSMYLDSRIRDDVGSYLKDSGFHERLIKILDYGSEELLIHTLFLLGNMKVYDPKIIEFLTHPNSHIRERALYVMYKTKNYNSKVIELLDDIDPQVRDRAITVLNVTNHYHTKIKELLHDPDTQVRGTAGISLIKFGIYDPQELIIKGDPNAQVKRTGGPFIIHPGMYDPQELIEDTRANREDMARFEYARAALIKGVQDKSYLKIMLDESEKWHCVFVDVIRSAHNRLKPQGYNPPVKKLVA